MTPETVFTIDVHISQIQPGDTIVHHGIIKTVCRKNIKKCDFMGISIFGDSYMSGHLPVKKVINFNNRTE